MTVKVCSKISKGFTLVEILVGMGLLSVLMLAMTEMMKSSNQAQNNVKLDMDTQSVAMTVGLAMQDGLTCAANIPADFSGPATFNNTLTPAQLAAVQIPLKKIVNKSGLTLYQVSSLIDPTLSIQNIYLTGITVLSPTLATAQIEIDGQKKGKTFLGSPLAVSQSAPFSIATATLGTTSSIVGCVGGLTPKILAQTTFLSCALNKYGASSHDCEGTKSWGVILPNASYQVYCSIDYVASPNNAPQIMYGWNTPTTTTFNYYIDSIHDSDTGRQFQFNCMAVE